METKTINLEEILWEGFYKNGLPKPTHTLAEITQKAVKEAMKEACRQALELAAENENLTNDAEITKHVDTLNTPEGQDQYTRDVAFIEGAIWIRNLSKELITNTINQVI